MIPNPIMAIDYGKKHIGIAVSDKLGIVSTPITVIHITPKITWENIMDQLREIINSYNIQSILYGIPQRFESNNNENIDRIKRFIDTINSNLDLPYLVYDESYSTKDAENVIVSNGSTLKRRKKKIDSIAASIFLQEYLDNIKK